MILKKIKNKFFPQYGKVSFSQEGEDLILQKIFAGKEEGFYVDVGAHHPKRFSNTCIFYKKGWRGINIDACPGSMNLFKKTRPRDINLETPVLDEEEEMEYFMFNEPALNSFDKELSVNRENDKRNDYHIIKTVKLRSKRLEDILDEYTPKEIDFLTVDVEGLDFKVLKSNNWDKYKPKVVAVEILGSTLEDVFNSEIYTFLSERDYRLKSKTQNTCFFLYE